MVQQVQVYLFGDQSYDFDQKLHDLLYSKNNPILSAFFEQACDAIRAEIGQLPLQHQASFPGFRSLADLLARHRKGGVNPAFQIVLAYVYQIGAFISQHGECGRAYPLPSDTYLLGLCSGAFAAAAISTCKSLSELLPAAVQTVRVSFRFGLCILDVRDRIEQTDASWSMVVRDLMPGAASEALKEFSQVNRLPPASQPWISAHIANGTTVNGTTVSGPPSVLEYLRKSPAFANLKTISIPIHVPGHTSRLFSADDVKWILKTTSSTTWASYTSKIPVVSSASGKLLWAENFRPLLEAAIGDMLMEPLRWDKINERLPLLVRSSGASHIKLTPIATTSENTFYSALKDFAQNAAESTKCWPHSPYPSSQEELGKVSVDIDYQEKTSAAEFQTGSAGMSKIAIVGMAGRFPEADDPKAFWDLLRQGLDVVKEVPLKRWDIKSHVDPTLKKRNTGGTPWGCWLDNAGLFDARFFGVSPKEAPQLDPAQRLALMSTYEAMEQAGIVPGATPSTQNDRVGVFHGVTSNDWMETNSAQDIDTHFVVGGNRAFMPGRINFCFDFSGPSYAIDTACSSSLAAVQLACAALWRGDIDTAIAGGTNMINNPDGHAGLDRGFFLSRTGNCKTFDDNADGYCRAEGVGTVILKRLEDALADGDPIQAVILAANTNHSADSDSITRPHAGTQKALFDKVLNATGVDAYDLSYIEMHGTGTQVGDAVEMESVLGVFAPENPQGRRRKDQALYLGAAKANIGHGEGVSGITSLIKVLLMMQKNEIPPHCGIKAGSRINRNYPTDLDDRNVHIAFKPTPWARPHGQTRKVLINNFSAAGGNTALLVEDAPIEATSQIAEDDPRSSYIVTLSAKCASSLKGNVRSMLHYITHIHDQDITLPQLSYTTTARRLHYAHRVVVSGSDLHEVKTKLEEALSRGDGTNKAISPPKILFAFTGQGSQYLGMGKQLFDAFSQFRGEMFRFDQLARSQGFPTFKQFFMTTDGDIAGFTPLVVQLATTCMQIALARLYISWGVAPSAVVGHSLGEYAALNIAGVLSDADTIYVVAKRAELLEERCRRGTHSMLAILASAATIKTLLAGRKHEIACINGPEDTVLGGSNEQISSLQTVFAAHKLKMTILKVPYAFHTSQVDPILESFETVTQSVTFRKPSVPVLCPLSSNVVTDAGFFGPKYLARHCREVVNMRDALRSAKEMKIITDKSFVIEIGPHPIVSGMVNATLGAQTKTFPTLQWNRDTWLVLNAALSALYSAGLDIKWREFNRDFKSSHKVLPLPAYSWDLKEYWQKYEGDWCLTKGETSDKGTAVTTPKPKLKTTTVHRLVEETTDGQKGTIIVESDFSDPDLNDIAKGHKVNQIPLTTPSVYADMALTVGKYLIDRFRPDMNERLVDVSDFIVEKALIPHSQGPQLVRQSAKFDWSTKTAECKFYSVNDKAETTIEHAWCTIRFKDRSMVAELQQKVPEYFSQMDRLRKGIGSGSSLRLNRTQGYKLISTLAQFHPDYRAVDELVLDSDTFEALSKVNFGQVKSVGSFSTHPAYIDVLTQTAGFVMNCKDSTDLETEIYISHGWDSFQVYEEISPKKTYQTYARMAKSEGTIWKGDTAMFDGDKIVAYFNGLALRGVPRAVFEIILASANKQNPYKANTMQNRKANSAASPAPPKVFACKATLPSATSNSQLESPSSNTTAPITQSKIEAPPTAPKPQAKDELNAKMSESVMPALQIISEESGVAIEELTDECALTDIGVDSLLSMVITSRFREELGLDLDLEFLIFLDLPTIKHLKDFLDPPSANATGTDRIVASSYVEPKITSHVEATTQITDKDADVQIPAATTYFQTLSAAEELIASALQVISEESGIAVSQLIDDCAFTDIGVDSILSMVIASRFREELGLDLEFELSIFLDLPTIKDLKQFLAGGSSDNHAVTSDEEPSSSETQSSESLYSKSIVIPYPNSKEVIFSSDDSAISAPPSEPETKVLDYCRPATSFILQGFPKTAQKTLFLLPDGGGSSSSYVPIPRLKADVAIIGLNCPYARDPWEMKCDYNDLIDSYMTEIRRRQPYGPYHLGGWSSGGIMSYMVAHRFIKQGDDVLTLIIIDSPVPKIMDRLPTKFYEFCDSIGLFGYAMGQTVPSTPDYLIPHFNATVDVLQPYRAEPISVDSKVPRVAIIWACESVLSEKNAPPEELRNSKGIHFLLEKRTDFGSCGWEVLLPGADFIFDSVAGNHFSMMQKPLINQVGNFIERAMAEDRGKIDDQ